MAGDYFYVDSHNAKKRTYYKYFQAFTHVNNSFTLKYEAAMQYENPSSFGNPNFTHQSLRSWTRIVPHPQLPHFYLLGINNLTAYDATNGDFIWTANIPPCSDTNTRPIIYNDATFFRKDTDNIYVAGTCVDDRGKTVIVLDHFATSNGAFNASFRQLYNLTDIGFSKSINLLNGFGEVQPEVTIVAPVNETLTTSVENRYFYVGFTHLMFAGVARIEHDKVANDWRVKTWSDHWTLINPSFLTHRGIVPTTDGLMALLDPSITGALSLVEGEMKHLIRFKTEKSLLGQIEEKEKYHTFTWYGGHEKYDVHLHWTLAVDAASDYNDLYVVTAPITLNFTAPRPSYIAKHSVSSGDVVGGAEMDFFALDTIVTNDKQLIAVGFEWTPSLPSSSSSSSSISSLSDIMPYLQRKAVFQVFENRVTENTCIGCQIDYFTKSATDDDADDGALCGEKCRCENGYCNDTLYGDGQCYCTLLSYGEKCRLCDGIESCNPTKGICDAGPHGTGECRFCFDLAVHSLSPINVSLHLGEKFGAKCEQTCNCNATYGKCNTSTHGGQCLYCTHPKAFGANCSAWCDCDDHLEYCSNGVTGTGCVAYDYGGLLPDKGWEFYVIIGSSLFVLLFSITFYQTNKQHKKQHHGESLPCCPRGKRNHDDHDLDIDNAQPPPRNNLNLQNNNEYLQPMINGDDN